MDGILKGSKITRTRGLAIGLVTIDLQDWSRSQKFKMMQNSTDVVDLFEYVVFSLLPEGVWP